MKRVLVAMSGGVDSSVAAALLVEQGYQVIGATMQVWDYSECELTPGQGTCCSSLDVEDARSVANKLGIPFYVINCEQEFSEKVINPFVESYIKGETPLPCSHCNTFLKFDHLVEKMKELDCDFIATGHYAQINRADNETYKLVLSQDSWKDQSYFLFTLSGQLLPKILFPVGGYDKTEVRKMAEARGLCVAKKPDSTGICFVGNGDYSAFVESQISHQTHKLSIGEFKRITNKKSMGQHKGIHHYTVGQSRGLGLSHHEKLFVVYINPVSKTVWLGDEKDLYWGKMIVTQINWIGREVKDSEKIIVKIRSTHKGAEAYLTYLDGKLDKALIQFIEPQRAITPGQAAVFYYGQELLGGGWISLDPSFLDKLKEGEELCQI